jgi:hypothetical protein
METKRQPKPSSEDREQVRQLLIEMHAAASTAMLLIPGSFHFKSAEQLIMATTRVISGILCWQWEPYCYADCSAT